MRIAVVGTVSSSMVSFRGPLLRALVDAGHDVFAFAMDYNDEAMEAVRELGATPVPYRLDRTGTHPLSDLRSTLELRGLFREHSIDRVFSYFAKPVIYATVAARLAGVHRCDAMLPGMGYFFTEDGSRRNLKRRLVAGVLSSLLRYGLARNETVVVYNDDDEAELVERGLVDPVRLARVNGTGIELADFPCSEPPVQPVTFVLAARLLGAKGVREYAHAARIVKRSHPDVRVVLLGGADTSPDGIDISEVERWVEEVTLEWPGRVADVRPWLESASVYVLPSYREGVPRSTQEALATGRPVITTDATGCRETVIDCENGFLVPPRDAEALAERMEWFAKNPERIPEMGRASRKLAEERFDVHAINRRLLQLLDLEAA